MIRLTDIEKSYPKQGRVLQIPHFEVAKGEHIGIAGNNGAGKTTLFKVLLNLALPDKGTIHIDGNDVLKSDTWKSSVATYLDDSFLIPYLTVLEYMEFVGKAYGISKEMIRQKMESYRDFLSDDCFFNKKYIRELSQGNRDKTGIIAALITESPVLILDEPFAHLDPGAQYTLIQYLKRRSEEAQCLSLISSHFLPPLKETCNRLVLLHDGSILTDSAATGDDAYAKMEDYFKGDK